MNIYHEVKRYELIWYILISIGAVVTILGIGFCYFKKRKLTMQYKVFDDEKEHGHQVVQQTMVT